MEETKQTKTQLKDKKQHKLFYAVLIEYAASIIVAGLFILYQGSVAPFLYRLINGLQVAGALLFVVGWFVFINHHGVFDVVTYGVKAFFLSFTNKKMEKSLLETRLGKKKMPAYLFISMWVNAVIVVAISYAIYFGFYV